MEKEREIATTAPDLICTIINTIANVCVGLKRCRVIIRCFVSFVFLRAGASYDPTSTLPHDGEAPQFQNIFIWNYNKWRVVLRGGGDQPLTRCERWKRPTPSFWSRRRV